MSSHHPAFSALGYGLGLHAELVPGDGQLGALPADSAGAAGRQRDPGQGGVRGGAHVETCRLTAWVTKCHYMLHVM